MSDGKATVTAKSGLNVRSGAGTQYSRVGGLTYGTTVSYSSETNGWLFINYNGNTGYISKAYPNITQAATNDGQNQNSGQQSAVTMYTNAKSLNVRTGPGTSYEKIGTLSYGTPISVIGTESNGWKKINYKSGIAYVSGKYVQETDPNGGSQNAGEQQQQSGNQNQTGTTKVVVNGSLNVRSEPNKNCSIIGSLHSGDVVTYDSDKDGWLHITSPQTGYIAREFTELDPKNSNTTQNDSGNIDTSVIGAGGLAYLSTKEVASRDKGRKTKQVIDLTTKKAFNVSWDSSPNYHSDCTPMTPQDTTVFKSIRNPNVSADDKNYWGQISSWSWNARPAAIQLKDGTWVACGYHQRPHAAIMGGNPGHPFSNQSNTKPAGGWPLGGHFCLYYGDSPGGTPKCNDAAKQAKDMSL